MIDNHTVKILFFSLLTALSSAGCSIGTEVGNGVKPSPDPRDENNKKNKADAPNPDNQEVSTRTGAPTNSGEDSAGGGGRSSSEKNQSPQSSSGPSVGAGNPSEVPASQIFTLLMNQCASPWSESYVPSALTLVGGTSSAPSAFKWTFQTDTSTGTSRLQWQAPAQSTHFIRKNNGGKTAYSIEMRDQAPVTSPLSPLGANVTCSQVLVAPGDLPGSQPGSLEQVSTNLSIDGLSAKIQWYTAPSGNGKSLKLIRIIVGPSSAIYDFKPE